MPPAQPGRGKPLMTLYRQLVALTLIVVIVLFLGTWAAVVDSARRYYAEQLVTQAQDTATSFGLSIAPYLASGDLATVETMLNAIYDRGYYRSIVIRDVSGREILSRVSDLEITGVPGWFVDVVELELPSSDSLLTSGWKQAGRLSVEGHPGYAYRQFWEMATGITSWFAIIGIAVAVIGGFGLRLLLLPLSRVEHQAESLAHRRYEIQDQLPRTRELRRVVEQMNRMTLKVREMFESEAANAEALRAEAYRDPLTGVGNRNYFHSRFRFYLAAQTRGNRGALLLAKINHLDEINDEAGHEEGDRVLREAAEAIRSATVNFPDIVLARMTGSDFAVYMPDTTPEDAEYVATRVAGSFAELPIPGAESRHDTGAVGGVTYSGWVAIEELLSEADVALAEAQQTPQRPWRIRALGADEAGRPVGVGQWQKTLGKVLADRALVLHGQSVATPGSVGAVLQTEVFARILVDHTMINAGIFVPMAERLELASSLDRVVLEKVFEYASSSSPRAEIAVNLSPSSLSNKDFVSWLLARLDSSPGAGPRIVFEFVEYHALRHLADVQDFATAARARGHDIALDHFGQGFADFGYLRSLRPGYVKLDGSFANELLESPEDSRFLVRSICSVAHSLDIRVFVEGVESERHASALSGLPIDGIQGYHIDQPTPVSGSR